MSMTPSPRAWAVVGVLGLCGCPKGGDVVGPTRPTVLGDRCGIEHAQSAPLIVDWPASARSRLEAAVLRGGVLPVKVSACDIEPLWQCEPAARYAYASATSRREAERIADEKSLYARVPVSAVSLEARVAAGGELTVDKITVGRFESQVRELAERELTGDCGGATHFVSAVDVGAFELTASRSRSAAAGAQAASVGAGGQASSERELLSRDGELDRCASAGPGQPAPPAGCGAPIQIELTPLLPSLDVEAWRQVATAAARRILRECSVHGEGSSELWILVEPSGHMTPAIGQLPFGDGPLSRCVLDVWQAERVPPFSGPALATRAYVYVYPADRHAEHDELIDRRYRELVPGIPPRALGDEIGYDFARYGVTPTDAWQ